MKLFAEEQKKLAELFCLKYIFSFLKKHPVRILFWSMVHDNH